MKSPPSIFPINVLALTIEPVIFPFINKSPLALIFSEAVICCICKIEDETIDDVTAPVINKLPVIIIIPFDPILIISVGCAPFVCATENIISPDTPVTSADETFVVIEDTSLPFLFNVLSKSDTHLNEPIISFILGFIGTIVVPLV